MFRRRKEPQTRPEDELFARLADDTFFFCTPEVAGIGREMDPQYAALKPGDYWLTPPQVQMMQGLLCVDRETARACFANWGACYVSFGPDGRCNDAGFISGDDRMQLLAARFDPIMKERFLGAPRFDFAQSGHATFAWIDDPDGLSFAGGAAPADLVLPPDAHPLDYQHIAFLSVSDLAEPAARVVNGDGLHVLFPLLNQMDADAALFDVTDPRAPKPVVGHITILSAFGHETLAASRPPQGDYGALKYYEPGDSFAYEARPITRRPYLPREVGTYADASHAPWIHGFQVPLCPQTQAPMIFLGAFGNEEPAVKNAFTERARSGPNMGWALSSMRYGEGPQGMLVFFSPAAQLLAVIPQD